MTALGNVELPLRYSGENGSRHEKAKKSLEQSYENQEKDADFNQNKLVLGSRQDYKEYKLGGKKKLTKRKHSRRKRGGKKTRRNRRSKK